MEIAVIDQTSEMDENTARRSTSVNRGSVRVTSSHSHGSKSGTGDSTGLQFPENPLVELMYLRETNGIMEYHESFEKLRSKTIFSGKHLVKAYLVGLETDTQAFVRRYQPQSINECFVLGRMYEKVHHRTYTSEGSSSGNCGLSVSLGTTTSVIPDVELTDSEAMGSESKIEPESVPVILKCSSLGLEPTGEMTSIMEIDIVQQENLIMDRELLEDEIHGVIHGVKSLGLQEFNPPEPPVELHKRISDHISSQATKSTHTQVPKSNLEPSFQIYKEPLSVNHDYYSGFNLSDLVERSELAQRQIDCLAVNLENSTTLLSAHQLFEQMILREQQQWILSKMTKSWKFKYKFKRQSGLSFADVRCFVDLGLCPSAVWKEKNQKQQVIRGLSRKQLLVGDMEHVSNDDTWGKLRDESAFSPTLLPELEQQVLDTSVNKP
ncbi:hypothetical protein Bca4012_058423 [Brassica carinata]|uniref:Uncharacterized protein n=1 Tax=Brassica carinata TaxID=52824 RepID=A0A8X8B564_BRACI|nr:hypothetical protein Bca52824_016188 [Brassica carinata]